MQSSIIKLNKTASKIVTDKRIYLNDALERTAFILHNS